MSPQGSHRATRRQRGWGAGWRPLTLSAVYVFSVAGCSMMPSVSTPSSGDSLAGIVVADEPRAALAGREILSAGGSAADAAIATAFALSVTLPSRAGLGAGGVCIAFDPSNRRIESFDFTAPAGASSAPGLPRGMYALYDRFGGGVPWARDLLPAETLARRGTTVSRALAQDLALHGLALDPQARQSFSDAEGRPLTEGALLLQPALGGTLARIRGLGAGVLYEGDIGAEVAQALKLSSVSGMTVRAAAPKPMSAGGLMVYFPSNAPVKEGEVQAVDRLPTAADAAGRLAALLKGTPSAAPSANSTGFAVVSQSGSAVACDLTMGKPFGTGKIIAQFGFLAASSGLPALQPALGVDEGARGFRFALAAPIDGKGTAIACNPGSITTDHCVAGSGSGGLVSLTPGE